MIHAEAVERAARDAQDRMYGDNTGPWEDVPEEEREWHRSLVEPILAASGYPAALTEATTLLRDVLLRDPQRHRPEPLHRWCSWCDAFWPCPVERARVWLADHEKAGP